MFHPNIAEYIFFLGAIGTSYKLGYAFGLTQVLTSTEHEVISCILSNNNGIKLDTNKRICTNSCRLNSTLLMMNGAQTHQQGKCPE